METSLIKVGNSKGIRIPKSVIKSVNFHDRIKMVITDKGLLLEPINDDSDKGYMLSEKVLAKDWLSPEEDAAWANLQ